MTHVLKTGTIVLVLGMWLAVIGWRGLRAPPHFDDKEWAKKTYSLPGWYGETPRLAYREFLWETTVPSLYRWYGGAVVRIAHAAHTYQGADIRKFRAASDYRGSAPADTRDALRAGNVVLYGLMLLVLWCVAGRILRSDLLAAVAMLPLALSPTFGACVAWRLGPDALLCLMCALVLTVWLEYHTRQSWGLLLLVSLACGLAVSTKQNGLFLVVAWCGYLFAHSRGPGRATKCLVAGVTAFAIFALLNPMLLSVGPVTFIARSVEKRQWCMACIDLQWGPMSWFEVRARSVPVWPIIPLFALSIWRCRTKKWFAPVAWWGGCLFFGTLLTVNRPQMWYSAPLEVGLYYFLALVALEICREETIGEHKEVLADTTTENNRPAI